ncbi:unnamed protein product [Meloidogyne enterolobii]|uniref:Uncharacterized protein n=1 Tax=Meloidogyne enterolobii TaxID=390850 RepID=A0ACB1A2V7_MELEN
MALNIKRIILILLIKFILSIQFKKANGLMLTGLVDLNNLRELEEQFPNNDDENEEDEEEEIMDEFQKRSSPQHPTTPQLNRFFKAYFAPIIQRRSIRDINLIERNRRKAFQRTGGTILLGKRIGGGRRF